VSRYKLSRSQKSVTVQDFNCGLMRVSGCKNYYQSVLGVGAKAKTMTNNLPILSVLGLVLLLMSGYCRKFFYFKLKLIIKSIYFILFVCEYYKT